MKKAEFNHKAGTHFEIAGASIYYEVIENKGKPTLLFLHGGLGNMADFNPVIPLFADDYQIVGIDSRGHGKSTLGIEKLTYKRLQLDVEAIINHLGLNAVNVIGFSDGGVVAYRLALSDKVSIQKIVTTGAVCGEQDAENNKKFFEGVTHEDYLTSDHFKHNFDLYEQQNPQPDVHKFIEYIEEMWFDNSENGYPDIISSTINVPTLIIRGNDDIDTIDDYVKMLPKIPNSILCNVPFEGHTPTFEKYPQFFVEVIKDFLISESNAKDISNLNSYSQ